MTSARMPATLGAVCAALLVLGGCGSDGGATAHEEPAISASPLAQGAATGAHAIRIGIHHGKVTPDGKRVQVRAGSPVTLVIDADRAGELHVHSSPERHIEYPAGRSAATLTLDQPGIVDVESHALDALIVQLEVR